METIKTVILITCIVGVITAIADISLPEGGLKKQVSTILGLVLILTAVTPFMGRGFTVNLKDYTQFAEFPEYGEIKKSAQQYYLDEAEQRFEEYFKDKLNSNGIDDVYISVIADINLDNEIELEEVKLRLKKASDKDRAEALIKADLPDVLVTFLQEDEF